MCRRAGRSRAGRLFSWLSPSGDFQISRLKVISLAPRFGEVLMRGNPRRQRPVRGSDSFGFESKRTDKIVMTPQTRVRLRRTGTRPVADADYITRRIRPPSIPTTNRLSGQPR